MNPPQRRLILALYVVFVAVAACAAGLFAIGLEALGAIAVVGLILGLVGLLKCDL